MVDLISVTPQPTGAFDQAEPTSEEYELRTPSDQSSANAEDASVEEFLDDTCDIGILTFTPNPTEGWDCRWQRLENNHQLQTLGLPEGDSTQGNAQSPLVTPSIRLLLA